VTTIFRLPGLNGLWTFEIETKATTYNPYKEMKLTYLVLLWQEGASIYGSGEKVQEDVNGAVRTYTGQYRSRIEIRGYLTKKYLGCSEVAIHYREVGERRESSTMHTLRIKSDGEMSGEYASTIANSSGSATWRRGPDGFQFEGLV